MALVYKNAPEGLAVAFALLTIGYSRMNAFLIAGTTGLFEPIMGLIGVSIVTVFLPILPIALGFAAGSYAFCISHEIIPETHRRGHENWATGGFTFGLLTIVKFRYIIRMSIQTDSVGRNALIIAFIINLIMITADLAYGLMMNSASLLSDAANNAGDVFILGSSILVLSSTTVVKND